MEVFRDLPTDIVSHILSYDKRFSIADSNIVNKLELDIEKYKDIIRQLVIFIGFIFLALLIVILFFILFIIFYFHRR
jgi:hypothetical protein